VKTAAVNRDDLDNTDPPNHRGRLPHLELHPERVNGPVTENRTEIGTQILRLGLLAGLPGGELRDFQWRIPPSQERIARLALEDAFQNPVGERGPAISVGDRRKPGVYDYASAMSEGGRIAMVGVGHCHFGPADVGLRPLACSGAQTGWMPLSGPDGARPTLSKSDCKNVPGFC